MGPYVDKKLVAPVYPRLGEAEPRFMPLSEGSWDATVSHALVAPLVLREPAGDGLQVRDERLHRLAALDVIPLTQNRRWMSGQRHQVGELGVHRMAPVAPD